MSLPVLLFVLAQAAAPAAPTAPTILSGPELLRAIREAPEETPGKPGLYSVRLAARSDHPVLGIRRTAAGRSEIHARFSDVWFVLEGSATIVTGGSVVGGEETQPGETRGATIAGGDARAIRAGDFGVVPPGVPHWISAVGAEGILYVVVKVPAR